MAWRRDKRTTPWCHRKSAESNSSQRPPFLWAILHRFENLPAQKPKSGGQIRRRKKQSPFSAAVCAPAWHRTQESRKEDFGAVVALENKLRAKNCQHAATYARRQQQCGGRATAAQTFGAPGPTKTPSIKSRHQRSKSWETDRQSGNQNGVAELADRHNASR